MQADAATAHSDIYRFGRYQLQVSSRELLEDGTVVELQPKVFDLLLFLIRNRQRAISKDELQDAVWPGLIITETALTRAVMKARRAVGDDADRQAVIKTVHGHGYRFIAELEDLTTADSGQAPHRPKTRLLKTPVLLGAIAVLLVFLLFTWWPRGGVAEGSRLAILPVINSTGNTENDWIGYGVMSFVARILKDKTDVEISSDREVINGLDGELEAAWRQGFSASLVPELKKRMEASHLLVVELQAAGDQFDLSYQFINEVNDVSFKSFTGDQIMTLAQRLGEDLVKELKGSSRFDKQKFRSESDDPFVNELYARGMALQLAGDPAAAIKHFSVAVEEDPGLFWLQYEYALSTRDLGNIDEAIERLEGLLDHPDAVETNERRAATLNALCIAWWQNGELQTARDYCDRGVELARAMENNRTAAALYTNLGIITRRLKEYESARTYLGQAVLAYQQAGENVIPPTVYNTLANLESETGDSDKAEEYLKKALESLQHQPNKRFEAAILNNLGVHKRNQGRWTLARSYLDKSLELRREILDRRGQILSLDQLASLNVATGRFSKAAEQFREAVALAKELGFWELELQARRRLASLLWDTGYPQEASVEAGLAAGIAETHDAKVDQQGIAGMQIIYDTKRDDAEKLEALQELERSLYTDEKSELLMRIRLEIARLHTALQDIPRALSELQRIAAWAQENDRLELERDASLELVGLLKNEGELDEAGVLLGRLTTEWPEHAGIAIARADLAELQNDPAVAITWLEKGKQLSNERWSEADEARLTALQDQQRTAN